jgi:molybdenum cofactor cytidylyltransferase
MPAAVTPPALRGQTTKPVSLGAVLMAAGAGARMGHRPKSLLEMGGVPLIRRQLAALRDAGANETVVVLGHHAPDIAPQLAGFALTVVHNPNPDAGPVSSQRLGLQTLSGQTDAVLMALADQPLVNAQDLRELMEAFSHRPEGASLLYPQISGQPGNPVIFTAGVRAAMLACPPDVGCKQWRQQNPQQARPWDTGNRHFFQDVDTPEDVRQLALASGYTLQWPPCWQRPGDA